jgi:hypothetical protein
LLFAAGLAVVGTAAVRPVGLEVRTGGGLGAVGAAVAGAELAEGGVVAGSALGTVVAEGATVAESVGGGGAIMGGAELVRGVGLAEGCADSTAV